MEIGHTLILGWSEKGMALLQQIALANLSEGGLPIVVLCPENKEDMQNTVLAATLRKKDRLQLHGSRVIFRSGNPINEHDLVRPPPRRAPRVRLASLAGRHRARASGAADESRGAARRAR